jgi:hypothetical protein
VSLHCRHVRQAIRANLLPNREAACRAEEELACEKLEVFTPALVVCISAVPRHRLLFSNLYLSDETAFLHKIQARLRLNFAAIVFESRRF